MTSMQNIDDNDFEMSRIANIRFPSGLVNYIFAYRHTTYQTHIHVYIYIYIVCIIYVLILLYYYSAMLVNSVWCVPRNRILVHPHRV